MVKKKATVKKKKKDKEPMTENTEVETEELPETEDELKRISSKKRSLY